MSDKYKKTFRGYLIDHHSPAPPIVDFTNLNISEYEEFFKQANITNLMLYTKDHWGYSYYNTKVGTKHEGLKIDFIKEISDVLKKNNIEFNAYYCIEYDTLAPKIHPEWAIRDRHNNPVLLKGRMAKWGMPCYETGYRQYVLGQLAEVVENYHPDSLFLDIFGKTLCYCNTCKKKFKDKYGYDLPIDTGEIENEVATLDFGEKGHDVNEFLEDCAMEMLKDVIDTVKSIDSKIKVTINFAALYPKKIRDMLDYQFTEPWAGNWLSAMYSRDTAKGQFPQLGPGDVSEVYNYKDDSIYELAAAQIAAQGCRVFMYSGSQHVDGTLEHTEAEKIGKAYGEIAKIEQYLGEREVIADIGIIQSDLSSISKSGTNVVINAIGRCKKSDVHREAILGAMKLCDTSKYSFEIVPEQQATLEQLLKYKCIILAGTYHISCELKESLTAYVLKGGKIVADGECGLYNVDGSMKNNFAISEMLDCKFNRVIDEYKNAQWGGYINCVNDDIWKYTPNTYPPMGSIQFDVDTTSSILGYITNPATPLTQTTWVNWWCPPPSTKSTNSPAIVKSKNCYYIAYDFFREVNHGLNLSQGIFNGIIESIIPSPTIKLETHSPNCIGYVAYQKQDDIVIHIISHLAEQINGNPPYIDAGKIIIKTSKTTATLAYPQKINLPTQRCGEYLEITLPEIKIHEVIVIS